MPRSLSVVSWQHFEAQVIAGSTSTSRSIYHILITSFLLLHSHPRFANNRPPYGSNLKRQAWGLKQYYGDQLFWLKFVKQTMCNRIYGIV